MMIKMKMKRINTRYVHEWKNGKIKKKEGRKKTKKDLI